VIKLDGKRLAVSGPLTFRTHQDVRAESGSQDLAAIAEIDLSQVSEVDSSALSLIFFWQRAAGGSRVTLFNPPASLLALAELYGVVDLLNCK